MKNTIKFIVGLLCLLTIFSNSMSAWAGYHHKRTIFSNQSGIKIATSVPQLAEIAKRIGGKHVSVVSLLKSDKDTRNPKLYKSMVKAVKEADILLRLSSGIDPYIEDLIKKAGGDLSASESEHCFSCLTAITSSQQSECLQPLLANKSNQKAIAQTTLSALISIAPRFENDFRAHFQTYMQSLQAENSKNTKNKQIQYKLLSED